MSTKLKLKELNTQITEYLINWVPKGMSTQISEHHPNKWVPRNLICGELSNSVPGQLGTPTTWCMVTVIWSIKTAWISDNLVPGKLIVHISDYLDNALARQLNKDNWIKTTLYQEKMVQRQHGIKTTWDEMVFRQLCSRTQTCKQEYGSAVWLLVLKFVLRQTDRPTNQPTDQPRYRLQDGSWPNHKNSG